MKIKQAIKDTFEGFYGIILIFATWMAWMGWIAIPTTLTMVTTQNLLVTLLVGFACVVINGILWDLFVCEEI